VTQIHLLTDVRTVLIEVVFLECILYTLGVSTFWAWWQTDFGWTIVLKTLAIAVVLLPANLLYVFHVDVNGLGWQWESVAGLALVGVMIAWRFLVTWTIQRFDPPPITKSARRTFRANRRAVRAASRKGMN
jgi:hypothetical protein